MNLDPNAQDLHYDPYVEGHSDLPPRTSILAVFSAVIPVACCIPGIGILAMLMAAMSLSFISRSHGRLSGRGAAGFGIVLGLIVTVLQGAIVFGGLQGWKYYTRVMVGTTDTFIVALDQGDFTTARSMLSADADSDLTDERLQEFVDTLRQVHGPVTGATTDFEFIGNAFASAYDSSRQNSGYNVSSNNEPFIPVALATDRGAGVLVYVGFDENSLATTSPLIIDLAVFAGTNEIMTLREDGPARDIAFALGGEHITLEEARGGGLPAGDADADSESESDEPGF